MFAKVAEQEKLTYLASIFTDNANMERHHAERFFGFLKGGPVQITATYPAGKLGTSEENLILSIEGEQEEN